MIVLYTFALHLIVKADAFRYIPESVYSEGHYTVYKYITKPEDIPFQVLIAYSSLYCSGALIRSKVIVTAASCFVKWNNQRVVTKIGASTVVSLGQVIEVAEIKRHEYFGHHSSMDNDIALLMLKEHVIFGNNVKKIPLVESDTALYVGSTLDVSGWGGSGVHHKYQNVMLWSEMVLLSSEDCKKYYKHLMTKSNFCVKFTPERRLCDNGGPAVYGGLLVGILSFGASNFVEPFVAVVTNVSYFNRWITLNANRFMEKYCVDRPEESEEYPKSLPASMSN